MNNNSAIMGIGQLTGLERFAKFTSPLILKGTNAKAKANAVQGIPEMIEIATNGSFEINHDENGKIVRYNVLHAVLLVRHAQNGKKYLYEIIKIKKETSTLFQSKDLTQ